MRRLSDADIDFGTSPDLMRKMAGYRRNLEETYDLIKEIRVAGVAEVSKYTGKDNDGWRWVASIPPEQAWALTELYTPEELSQNKGEALKKWINRHTEVKVTEEHLQ